MPLDTDDDHTTTHADTVSAVVGACMVLLVLCHVALLQALDWRGAVLVAMFLWFAFTVTVAHLYRPHTKSPLRRQQLKVAAIVAIRDTEPLALQAMLDSLDNQTVLPHVVYVVENGCICSNAEAVFREWATQSPIKWKFFLRRSRFNKREAHAAAVVTEREAAVILMIDGHTVLDRNAIREGLKPLRDDSVMSVGGLLVGRNYNKNLLTRVLDISFVSAMVVERAACSQFGSVVAHRGGLAFYRTWVVKRHLHDYLTQTVVGRSVASGDDRMLTGLAALEGKTVFQVTCVGYTLLPETMRHASDRQTRWWRALWVGSVWIIRRFSPRRAIWWLTVFQMASFVLYAAVTPLLLVVDPVMTGQFPWLFIAYLVMLGYVRSARTLAIKRPGQSARMQIASFLMLSPLATLIDLWFGVVLLWHGMFTPHQTAWQPHKVKVSA